MRAPKLERSEIEFKTWLQFFTVPCITAKELLVVVALFVPSRQQRTGEVEAPPIPALRHHVHLPANLLLVNLFGFVRVGNVEHAALAVTKTIHKQRLVIGAEADVDRKHTALNVADRRNLCCLPLAPVILVNEPKF